LRKRMRLKSHARTSFDPQRKPVTCTTSPAPPDYAPVPRSSLGPAVNEDGYYVGRVELFFGGLSKELVAPLCEALDAIYDRVVQHGTLPAPGSTLSSMVG
jgi:hypothetical protein